MNEPAIRPPLEEARYDYYFGRDRPAFVSRLIARKQAMHLELASRGRTGFESVLELGPGEGWFGRACREAGVERYLAVEGSAAGTDAIRSLGFDVVTAMVPPLPPLAGTFELVYASHFVEHLAGPGEVLQLLDEARGVLAPGGRIALAFPDARALGADFWDCDYTHRWPSTPRRIRQAAHDAGLRVVAEHRCCLHLTGTRARLLRAATRLAPLRTLGRLAPSRDDFFNRGRLLFATDYVVVLEPRVAVVTP